ncbi:unnamed protein product [Lactuca saligna]|uniref:Uncharacterized protein n=1 Tax=Lactuca saligna TaxID=75948 RepID=A0AA35ZNY8_LACSI|nr:unnamed protein product [Lactuca saligna]
MELHYSINHLDEAQVITKEDKFIVTNRRPQPPNCHPQPPVSSYLPALPLVEFVGTARNEAAEADGATPATTDAAIMDLLLWIVVVERISRSRQIFLHILHILYIRFRILQY